MKQRVVITGYGVVSPYGTGRQKFKTGLLSGKNTTQRMKEWDLYQGLNSKIASPVPQDYDLKEIPRKSRRAMSPMSIYGVLATLEALEQAKLTPPLLNDYNSGLIIGSTIGSPITIHETFKQLIESDYDISGFNSMAFWKAMSNSTASNIAQFLELKGMVTATAAACASSLQAIGLGYRLIRSGEQKLIVAGGVDELHPAVTASFDILEATSIKYNESPSKTPRPFDKDRDGLVCSEGAGILILEEYEHAINRKAPIFAEIIGYATTTSHVSISQSSPESLSECMNQALNDAHITPKEIDYISAHATGTIHGDISEAKAIYNVLGDNIPVSSLKGYLGHTLGASGALELIATLFMMEDQTLIPGFNLDNIDSNCKCVGHFFTKTSHTINTFLKNAFAFGGINTSLICRR